LVNSKTEKLSSIVSLFIVHHLRARTGVVGPMSV